MTNKEEVKIFRIVKLMPIFVILISLFSIYILYKNNQVHLTEEVERLTAQVMLEKENVMKNEVLRVYDHIKAQKRLTAAKMQANLKERVQEAHTILSSIYNNNRDKSDQQIKKLITDTLRDLRFNGKRGYFFIYETNGVNVMHPILPHLQGKNLWDFKDIKGDYVIQNISDIAKKRGEGALIWWWKKPLDEQTEYEKMGYVKYFAPFDWFIGTGDFIVDYEGQLQEELLSEIIKIRYGEDNYIFIIDQEGIFLSHAKHSYIGTNRLDYKDADGVLVNKEILSIGKTGQGFLSYMASVTASENKPSLKRSFVIGFDDWQWVIGSGIYLDGIADIVARRTLLLQQKNSKELLQHIVFAVFISLGLFFTSLFFSHRIKKRFLDYQEKVHQKNISLYNLNLNLERLVFSRTTALAEANQNLQSTLSDLESTQGRLLESEKMASMVGLVTGMAHELNTPLGIMVTSISQVESEVEYLFERLKSQQLTRKDLQRVEQSWLLGFRLLDDNLQRSVRLVKNFKSLSTHNASDEMQTFSMRSLLDSIADTFVNQFKESDVKIDLVIEKDIILINYQWVLGEVLSQLINNSLTHGLVNIANPRITIDAQEEAGEVMINYSDNGCGSEEVDKIFEPFYTTKRGSDCTGLGLPIIYNQIIYKLQGSVSSSRCEKQGLAFMIKIPKDISLPIGDEETLEKVQESTTKQLVDRR